MDNKQFLPRIKYATITGNFAYIAWVLFNGLNEGFEGTLPEKFSYAGMIVLFTLNSILLLQNREKKN